jgi:hypothetical protein
LRHRLARAFSTIKVEQMQCTAYTMPRVRPNHGGAPEALALHYSPDTLKVELLLEILREEALDGVETLVLNRLTQWGREPFVRFSTNGAQQL